MDLQSKTLHGPDNQCFKFLTITDLFYNNYNEYH
jgi:hypothetical protein